MANDPGAQAHVDAARAARKDDHLRLALAQQGETVRHNEFDDLDFVFHALGGVSSDRVSLSTTVCGSAWSAPFYINGMTGGTEQTERINRELAIAARETGVAMGCGSVSIALDEPDDAAVVRSFTVIRQENPDGFVMANIGVGRGPDDARRAVDLIDANALQVHLNAVQETAMPEGHRDFSDWAGSLERIVAASPVPVIVKEVGFGLSRETLERLRGLGVGTADLGGTGGTDFLRIENARQQGLDFSYLSGIGQSALACLLDAPGAPDGGTELLASGGVRNPFDVAKALAVGARAAGVAGVFLRAVHDGGAERLVPLIHGWFAHLEAILALFGAQDPAALARTDLIVRGRLREFAASRGVDLSRLARRSRPHPDTQEQK